jgi:glycosyltransferase involved in cell wall biosynthesis
MQRLDHRNALRYEAWVRKSFDTTVVVSKEDAATLGGAPLVIPNGVDLHRFSPSELPRDPRVVFTGALYTQPNVDGVLWFADHVWPAVLDRVPGATLDIVGLRPAASVSGLADRPSIAVHADVESTVPFLERSRVAVVPIRVGSGSRMKALEAMAAGRPVVGTTIGLGGLEVRDGIECRIADEPLRFAAAIADLLLDAVMATALSSAGRSLVEQRYGWHDIAASYVDAMTQRVGR